MLNEIIDTVRLDIGKSPVNVCIYVRKNDERILSFILENNGSVIDLSDVTFAAIIIARDNTQTYSPMTRYGNKLMYTLHQSDVSGIGESKCMIQIGFSDNSQITSPSFSMMVEAIPLNINDMMESNDYGLLIAMKQTFEKAQADCISYAKLCEEYYDSAEVTIKQMDKILENSDVLIALLNDIGDSTVTTEDIDAMWNGTYVPDADPEPEPEEPDEESEGDEADA